MEISHRATKALVTGAVGIAVVVVVRMTLDFSYNRYERRLRQRDPMAVARRRTTFNFAPARDRCPRRIVVAWSVLSLYDITSQLGEGAARLERRAGPLRRARLQHPALEPRLGAARLVHAAPPARRPDHGRRRDRLRRGDGPDLHDARHRRRPPHLRPEHAADDEHDRQPHDQGPPPRRHGPLPRLDRDADPGGARRAARGDREPRRHDRRERPRASSARSATAPSGSRPRRTGRSTPTSSRSRAICASTGWWRCGRAGFSRRRAPGAWRSPPGKRSARG